MMAMKHRKPIVCACLLLCLFAKLCGADQRCYVFSGYELGQALLYVGHGQEDGERDRAIILYHPDKEEGNIIYGSKRNIPFYFMANVDRILVSDIDADDERILTVIDRRGIVNSRYAIGSKGDRVRTAGWLPGGTRYYYSEECSEGDEYVGGCPISKGIYIYDMEQHTKILVSNTERRVDNAPSLGGLLLSNDCFDPPKDVILFKLGTAERIPHPMNGMNVSLEGDYYYAEPSEANEEYNGVYNSADGSICAEVTKIRGSVNARKWLVGNRLLLERVSFSEPLLAKQKATYIYDMKECRLQKIPGCFLAMGDDSRYALIINLEGRFQEVRLEGLPIVKVEDLPDTSPKKPETTEGVSANVPNREKAEQTTKGVSGDVPNAAKEVQTAK